MAADAWLRTRSRGRRRGRRFREPLGQGQRALQGGPVIRPAVRREHVLDRQLEQRTQAFDDLLPRHRRTWPPRVDLEALAGIDESVASDDRAMALDPEQATTAVWRSAASFSISLGGAIGSKSKRRSVPAGAIGLIATRARRDHVGRRNRTAGREAR